MGRHAYDKNVEKVLWVTVPGDAVWQRHTEVRGHLSPNRPEFLQLISSIISSWCVHVVFRSVVNWNYRMSELLQSQLRLHLFFVFFIVVFTFCIMQMMSCSKSWAELILNFLETASRCQERWHRRVCDSRTLVVKLKLPLLASIGNKISSVNTSVLCFYVPINNNDKNKFNNLKTLELKMHASIKMSLCSTSLQTRASKGFVFATDARGVSPGCSTHFFIVIYKCTKIQRWGIHGTNLVSNAGHRGAIKQLYIEGTTVC